MRRGNIIVKFAFYTDIQLTGLTPRHRVDDFPRVLLGKLREVYDVALAEGCDFVAYGGDFFNSHRVYSFEVIGDAMDVICESPLKTYSCIGEHDLYGHSPKTYPTSTLAFFVRRCPQMVIVREPVSVDGAVIHAKHEWEDMFDAMKRPVDDSKLNILLCHELITDDTSLPFDMISTSKLQPCPFDIVASGDLHCGYDAHEVGGTWFLNPGSLGRRAVSDIDRWPQIAIVTAEKGSPPVIEYRKLNAKRGDEVFGESVADVVRAQQEFNGDAFAKELLDFEAETEDVHDLVQKTGKAAGVRAAVLDYLATKKGSEAV